MLIILLLVLQIIAAIKRILYATDDESVVAEAQAMLSEHQKMQQVSTMTEETGEMHKSDSQKRKSFINVDVDAVASNEFSPRQRFAETSDVHSSGSPLVSF